VIRVTNLRKSFGKLRVLNDLNLEIRQGTITALLGPNGAGKTTLVKSILGMVRPDSGEIEVAGVRIDGEGRYRANIGYMPQIARYPENLTVREIFSMIQDLRGARSGTDDELVTLFELEKQLDKPFKTLSGGNRQRVSAALAFMFGPSILFLDEPTAGLDPIASSTLKDKILRERRAGKTVVLTSHVLSEVEELADTIVYLLDGRVHLEEPVAGLLARTGENTLERAIAREMLRAVA
jgi:Cu-processing system ATP-binding protein